MKMYCQKCGYGNDYAIEKPNFCQKCGNSFKLIKPTISKAAVNKPPIITRQEEEDEDQISLESIQSMSSLDVEIAPPQDRRVKIENLLGTKSSASSFVPSENVSQVDKKEFMESFKREAGFYPTSRNSINEEE